MSKMSSQADSSSWLFGPIRDLAIGCGGLFWVFFAWVAVAGDRAETLLPMTLAPFIGILIGQPHYGATLLRVYSRAEDRRAYAFFAVLCSGTIWGMFALSVHVPWAGSLFLTLYLTLAPWHYAAQNYGIGVMLLRRNQVEFSTFAKRAYYASFILSTLLTVLSIHGPVAPAADYAYVIYEGSAYHFASVGIPLAVKNGLIVFTALAYAASIVLSVFLIGRRGCWMRALPAFALIVTQALWFSVPVLARHTGWLVESAPLSIEHSTFMILWIGVGHSMQYLWVTSYYVRRSGNREEMIPFYGKAVLAGTATFALPLLVFAPDFLGRFSTDAGLLVMITAAVNLHHYLLDAVIWKLRHGRIGNVLIRRESRAIDDSVPAERSAAWLKPALIGIGVFSLILMSADAGLRWVAHRGLEAGDARSVERALVGLTVIGRDSATLRHSLAIYYREQNDWERSVEAAERALVLHDRYEIRSTLCNLYSVGRTPSKAIEACRGALAHREKDALASNNLALLLAQYGPRNAENLNEAVRLAEQGCEARNFEDPHLLGNLALIYHIVGRHEDVEPTVLRALEIARKQRSIEAERKLILMLERIRADLVSG